MRIKLPDYGWQPPAHYAFWARWVEPRYDPDIDVSPARLFVAGWARDVNPDTAAVCILNCDPVAPPPPEYFEMVEWIKTIPTSRSIFSFAIDVEIKYGS